MRISVPKSMKSLLPLSVSGDCVCGGIRRGPLRRSRTARAVVSHTATGVLDYSRDGRISEVLL
jgi:hypothetical protein